MPYLAVSLFLLSRSSELLFCAAHLHYVSRSPHSLPTRSMRFSMRLFQTKPFFCSDVNRDRSITRQYVQHVEARGVKALFITVDAPQLGCRERVCV